VVVDYSAPNVAKEMHVGHLRTTVIGDALVRLLEFVGHTVIRENHIGDWGTPFGMLIEHMVDLGGVDAELTIDQADPSAFYREARAKFDASDEFKDRARARVTLLQSRTDAATMAIWNKLVDKSADYFDVVYGKLGVLLRRDDIVGESFYQPMMPAMLERLDQAGLLAGERRRQGGVGARVQEPRGRAAAAHRAGSHGGFNYATSDITCVLDRVERLHATLLVYCVGTPQSQHLQMVFKAAEMLGVLVPPARAVHVNNGNVLGEDRKILKSRSGEPAMLLDLVDAAIERGRAIVAERSPELPSRRAGGAGQQHRHRSPEVRRAVERPHQGLRLRLVAHAGVRGQHGAHTCSTRTPASAASSARPRSLSGRRFARSCPRIGEPAGAGTRAAAAAVRRAVHDTIER
jgi:arginyl-tRNA synthetase